jgi:hypothetical protein
MYVDDIRQPAYVVEAEVGRVVEVDEGLVHPVHPDDVRPGPVPRHDLRVLAHAPEDVIARRPPLRGVLVEVEANLCAEPDQGGDDGTAPVLA